MIQKWMIFLLIWIGGTMFGKEIQMNQSVTLKKGDQIKIFDQDRKKWLNIQFVGGGYEEGENDAHSSHAIFHLKFNSQARENLMIENVQGKPGQTRFENFLIILEFSDGIANCRLKVKREYPWIIVFKKEAKEKEAIELLKKHAVNFHEGMDSSRGKKYFYSTGPKFIAYFSGKESFYRFKKTLEGHALVYEIYEPDWHIHKD